jgi:hypothetical protein
MGPRLTAAIGRHRATLAAAILLVGLTLVVFWPALGHELLSNWDDPLYVRDNVHIHGLTVANLVAAFTRVQVANYAPLPLVSYMIDWELWGLDPFGFILTNLLFHAATGVLVFLLLAELDGAKGWPFAAACLFLLHPVQVESVVWVSQRKTVMVGFFLVLSLWAYVRRRRAEPRPARRLYAVALATFLLALLSKPVAAVLPLYLAAYELCLGSEVPIRHRLRATVPFFVVALVLGLVSVASQTDAGVAPGYHGGSAFATFLTMLPILLMYVRMVLVPSGLSVWYDPPVRTAVDGVAVVSAVLVGLLLLLGVWLYRRWRHGCFWYLTFFLGLLPVLQLIPLVTLVQDRYLYVPMLGAAALLAAALLPEPPAGTPRPRRQLVGLGVVIVGITACVLQTRERIAVWQNSETLWRDAVAKAPAAPMPYAALGDVALNRGDLDAAVKLLEAAIALASERAGQPGGDLIYGHNIAPDRVKLAVAYQRRGMIREAERELRGVLALEPDFPLANHNLGVLLVYNGNPTEGLGHLEKAVELAPENPRYREDLAEVRRRLAAGEVPSSNAAPVSPEMR